VLSGSLVRTPAVAGSFYPSHPLQLKTAVERFLVRTLPPVRPLALLVPHAGYIYSGSTAGKTFASSDLPPRLVLLCPNHTGMGAELSVWARGSWRTPLGDTPVDEEMAEGLLEAMPELSDEPGAHLREHAIEVQLPFLQVMLERFTVVPVCVGTGRYDTLERLGKALARVLASPGKPAAMVVSSDMNHYESAAVNRAKDELALGAVLRLDPAGLHRVVHEKDITMCGYAPAVAALVACRELGADRAELVDYTHSGMVTGDDDQVVSYAGVRIFREAA
jgi:AmmeMemoRadiSam system protein B